MLCFLGTLWAQEAQLSDEQLQTLFAQLQQQKAPPQEKNSYDEETVTPLDFEETSAIAEYQQEPSASAEPEDAALPPSDFEEPPTTVYEPQEESFSPAEPEEEILPPPGEYYVRSTYEEDPEATVPSEAEAEQTEIAPLSEAVDEQPTLEEPLSFAEIAAYQTPLAREEETPMTLPGEPTEGQPIIEGPFKEESTPPSTPEEMAGRQQPLTVAEISETPLPSEAVAEQPQQIATTLTNRAYSDKDYNDEVNIPVSIEIFGNKHCPYCVGAKELAGEIALQYPINIIDRDIGRPHSSPEERTSEENSERDASQKILDEVAPEHKTMPRVSIIDSLNNRWFLGGLSDLQYFTRVHFPPKAKGITPPSTTAEEPLIQSSAQQPEGSAPPSTIAEEKPVTKTVEQKAKPVTNAAEFYASGTSGNAFTDPYSGLWSAWLR